MDDLDGTVEAHLRGLVEHVPTASEATRRRAFKTLEREVDTEERAAGGNRRSLLRGRRALAIAFAILAVPAALAAAAELGADIPVFRSDTDPPVYSLSPVSDDAAEALAEQAGGSSADRGTSITTGDVAYCEQQESEGRLDPGCKLVLEAYRNGDFEPADGPVSTVHTIDCSGGVEPGPHEACRGETFVEP